MAHQTPSHLFTVLGFVIWGDLGALTIYRNKRGLVVWFKKTWPDKPPSPAQTIQRQKIIDAAAAWQSLSADSRVQWERASRRASLCATGYDIFVSWKLTGDDAAITTLQRQTDTVLLPP